MQVLFINPLKKVLFAAILALTVSTAAAADGVNAKPNLHMVSVGVDAAPSAPPALASCKKDAKDMANWAYSQRGKLYGEIDAAQLIEENATAANSMTAIKNLQLLAKPGDVSWLNWSSHGGHPRGGEYHVQAYDKQVPWSEIRQELSKVKGLVIVTLDTCHCGMASGDNLIVLSSCLKDQSSRAGSLGKNSLFTQYLLEALQGAADANHDGIVTLSEVETDVSNSLLKANRGQSMTVSRPVNTPSGLPIASVSAVSAPTPVAMPLPAATTATSAARNLAGTNWTGSELIPGTDYGTLGFEFQANGKVVMHDARNNIEGTYQVEGQRVSINIPGACDYNGTIDENTFSGHGQDAIGTWNFTVTMQR